MRGVRARVRLYAAGRSVQHTCRSARARATKNSTPSKQAGKRDTADTSSESSTESAGFGELGPIGLTVGGAGQVRATACPLCSIGMYCHWRASMPWSACVGGCVVRSTNEYV